MTTNKKSCIRRDDVLLRVGFVAGRLGVDLPASPDPTGDPEVDAIAADERLVALMEAIALPKGIKPSMHRL